MSPLISVIVPVYNKASRIEACLQSILSQDFQDYELLVVDDGSTDGSEAICTRYAELNSDKIYYFRKDNGGVSSARNTGMDIASGHYLCFVDADDYIRAGFLSALIKEAEGYDITTESSMLDKEWIGKKIADYADTEGRSMLGTAVWGKLYDRDFVIKSGVRFDESVRFGEDTLFNLNIWSKAVSIKALHSNLYVHTVDRTRRYELSAQEIRQKIEVLRMAYAQLDDAFGSHTDTIRDVNITLSLYPLSKIIEDDGEYMLLYKEYYPNTSEQDFFNDLRCSPVIRAISEAGIVASHYGLKGLRQMFKSISQTYHNQIPLIICPFRMHRIILWFLRHKMYMYCAMIVMLSNSMRNDRV